MNFIFKFLLFIFVLGAALADINQAWAESSGTQVEKLGFVTTTDRDARMGQIRRTSIYSDKNDRVASLTERSRNRKYLWLKFPKAEPIEIVRGEEVEKAYASYSLFENNLRQLPALHSVYGTVKFGLIRKFNGRFFALMYLNQKSALSSSHGLGARFAIGSLNNVTFNAAILVDLTGSAFPRLLKIYELGPYDEEIESSHNIQMTVSEYVDSDLAANWDTLVLDDCDRTLF